MCATPNEQANQDHKNQTQPTRYNITLSLTFVDDRLNEVNDRSCVASHDLRPFGTPRSPAIWSFQLEAEVAQSFLLSILVKLMRSSFTHIMSRTDISRKMRLLHPWTTIIVLRGAH